MQRDEEDNSVRDAAICDVHSKQQPDSLPEFVVPESTQRFIDSKGNIVTARHRGPFRMSAEIASAVLPKIFPNISSPVRSEE